MFDPTRYRELIDHLDDNSHQIWHYPIPDPPETETNAT